MLYHIYSFETFFPVGKISWKLLLNITSYILNNYSFLYSYIYRRGSFVCFLFFTAFSIPNNSSTNMLIVKFYLCWSIIISLDKYLEMAWLDL